MPNILHSSLTGSEVHEPKGIDTASADEIYVSDGAGSGSWQSAVTPQNVAEEAKFFVSDGSGGGTWKFVPTGWANYVDASSAQTFTSTAAKLSINNLGATNEDHLPWEIRGTGSLWDDTNDKITPITVGDAYDIRVNLPVTARSAANFGELLLDIGGAATPTIVIATTRFETNRVAPFDYALTMNIFTLNTFLTNGGQLFIQTDAGSIDITNPSLLITRIHAGDL